MACCLGWSKVCHKEEESLVQWAEDRVGFSWVEKGVGRETMPVSGLLGRLL